MCRGARSGWPILEIWPPTPRPRPPKKRRPGPEQDLLRSTPSTPPHGIAKCGLRINRDRAAGVEYSNREVFEYAQFVDRMHTNREGEAKEQRCGNNGTAETSRKLPA